MHDIRREVQLPTTKINKANKKKNYCRQPKNKLTSLLAGGSIGTGIIPAIRQP